MIDEQTEIVIRSQKELDKLFDDNYNAIYKVVFIDKDLRFDSRRTTYWKKNKAFFKHAIECKNIDAGLMKIESSSKLQHTILQLRKLIAQISVQIILIVQI